MMSTNSTKRILNFLLATAFCFHPTAGFSQEKTEKKPQNIRLFLIHGISGDSKTFGIMGQTLIRDLKTLRPDLRPENGVSISENPFSYPTHQNAMSTYQFADLTGRQICEDYKAMSGDKKFYVLVHSQGGVVFNILYVLSWYSYRLLAARSPEKIQKLDVNNLILNTYLQQEKESLEVLSNEQDLLAWAQYWPCLERVEKVVFLGSPVWGAKIPALIDWDNYPQLKMVAGLLGFGGFQAKELSLVSQTAVQFKQRAIKLDEKKLLGQIPLRPLIIGGALPGSKSHKMEKLGEEVKKNTEKLENKFGLAKGVQLESDGAVALHAARFQFFYAKDKLEGIEASDFKLLGETDSKTAGRIDNFKMVETSHLSMDNKKYFGMVEYPDWCAEPENVKMCNHPTYPLILAYLSGCDENPQKCIPNGLENMAKERAWDTKYHAPESLVPEKLKTFSMNIYVHFSDEIRQKVFVEYVPEANIYVERALTEKWGSNSIYPLDFIEYNDPDLSKADPRRRAYQVYFDRSKGATVTKQGIIKGDKSKNIGDEYYIRYAIEGHIVPSKGYTVNSPEYQRQIKNGIVVPVQISIPDVLFRKINFLVKPTYESFVEIDGDTKPSKK